MKGAKMKTIRRKITGYFLLCMLLLVSQTAAADYRLIDTAQLKAMLDAKEEFTLVDARTKEEYDEAHIVKAINITEKGHEAQASPNIFQAMFADWKDSGQQVEK